MVLSKEFFLKRISFFTICCLFVAFGSLGCGQENQNVSGLEVEFMPEPEAPPPSFISVWRTSSENESIILPLRSDYNYNFSVDWGDGSSNRITSYDDPDRTHVYRQAGDYKMTISGVLEAWYFNNEENSSKL